MEITNQCSGNHSTKNKRDLDMFECDWKYYCRELAKKSRFQEQRAQESSFCGTGIACDVGDLPQCVYIVDCVSCANPSGLILTPFYKNEVCLILRKSASVACSGSSEKAEW